MKRVGIVFWSGTGNTEQMANAVAEGVRKAGAEAALLTPAEFDESKVSQYDAIAFGCPAMGSETLEDMEFEPMFNGCTAALGSRPIALFGSYGWGDGEWMRSWEHTCEEAGLNRVHDSVICCEAPDDEALAACRDLGAALA